MVLVRARSTGTDCHAPPGVRALTEKLAFSGSPTGTGYTTSRSAFGPSVCGLSVRGPSACGLSAALAVPVAVPSREYAAAVAAAWRRVRRDGPEPWVSDMSDFLMCRGCGCGACDDGDGAGLARSSTWASR